MTKSSLSRRALLGALIPAASFAQQAQQVLGSVPDKPWLTSRRREYTAPELMDAPDEWIERSFAWIDDMLARFPPSTPEHPVRRAALTRLDDILHINSAPRKKIVQDYFIKRMERVTAEIESTKITRGARIWKLYNHGFLVRTPSVSYTYDFVPGPPRIDGFRIVPDTLKRLAAQSDATFISHLHSDHANQEVAQLFLSAGKPVVAPEGLWKDNAGFAARLTYPRRNATEVHEIAKLKVVAYPGHQGRDILNNVHLVTTPEGFTSIQTGDQSNTEDFAWIGHIGSQHKVDALLPNCWTTDIQRMVRGVNPRYVITGHENEMAHTVPHREDYTQTYNHLYGSPWPLVLMTWGESFHIV